MIYTFIVFIMLCVTLHYTIYSENKVEQLLDYHKYVPTFALSAGLRMWIKLIMSENFMDDGNHTEFKVEVKQPQCFSMYCQSR